MNAKPNWLLRTQGVVASYPALILWHHPQAVARRARDMHGPDHCLFMIGEIMRGVDGDIDSETKACRWLGWLQNELDHLNIVKGDAFKEANLASGSLAWCREQVAAYKPVPTS